MRFRKTLTFLILATALVLELRVAQPLLAVQPPARAQAVAPGLSPARAALKGGSTAATSSPAKPFTQEQVSSMVRDGLGDDSGAKLIEQRGIDFAPSGDFIQTLKAQAQARHFLTRCAPPSHSSPRVRRSRCIKFKSSPCWRAKCRATGWRCWWKSAASTLT